MIDPHSSARAGQAHTDAATPDSGLLCHVNIARGYRGGERQTELLIRALDALQVRQRLIARRGEPLARRLADLPGVDVREAGASPLAVLRHAHGAALVHVHEGRSVHAASLRHLLLGTPYLITRRVDNPINDNVATRRAYRNANSIVVLSNAIGKQVEALDGSLSYRVIPDATSALPSSQTSVRQLRASHPGKLLIGHAGALDHSHKGQLTLLEAAAKLQRSHPHLHFLLLGKGKDEALFRQRAHRLDNVDLVGFVDNIGDYLAALDVFVFPSLHEGLGSVLLDAMQFALPIVATRVGGIPEIVTDGVNGLLVQPGDPEQLRHALLRLVDDRELAARMGRQGRAMVQSYSADRIAQRYLEIYRPFLGATWEYRTKTS